MSISLTSYQYFPGNKSCILIFLTLLITTHTTKPVKGYLKTNDFNKGRSHGKDIDRVTESQHESALSFFQTVIPWCLFLRDLCWKYVPRSSLGLFPRLLQVPNHCPFLQISLDSLSVATSLLSPAIYPILYLIPVFFYNTLIAARIFLFSH